MNHDNEPPDDEHRWEEDTPHDGEPGDRDRRLDGRSRDRIGTLARAWRAWQRDVDAWRAGVDRRITRWSYLVLLTLVAFAVGFVAAGGALRGLYDRDADRSQQAARIVEQFQEAREQNARAACADENQLRMSLRALGRDLGGRRLERAVAHRFPSLDCTLYVRQTVTTGRRPQPAPTPSPSP
jgi:hypothetical protein